MNLQININNLMNGHQFRSVMSMDSCQIELSKLVADTGEVLGYLGGFEIIVLKEEFPYRLVFDFLLSLPHDIWLSKRDSKIVIKTKPANI